MHSICLFCNAGAFCSSCFFTIDELAINDKSPSWRDLLHGFVFGVVLFSCYYAPTHFYYPRLIH